MHVLTDDCTDFSSISHTIEEKSVSRDIRALCSCVLMFGDVHKSALVRALPKCFLSSGEDDLRNVFAITVLFTVLIYFDA